MHVCWATNCEDALQISNEVSGDMEATENRVEAPPIAVSASMCTPHKANDRGHIKLVVQETSRKTAGKHSKQRRIRRKVIQRMLEETEIEMAVSSKELVQKARTFWWASHCLVL